MNDILTCIIIEDDALASSVMSRWCSKHEFLDLKASFEEGQSALNYLKEEPVDLLFLDIELKDMKGWELLDNLNYRPQVIVISGNKEYAVEAFQYKVADFIQKPATPTMLDHSIQQVLIQRHKRSTNDNHQDVYVKANGKLHRLSYDSILYIENLADYVKIYSDQGNHVIYCTMKYLEKRLPESMFVKIHRSYIINLSKIMYVEDNDVMVANRLIPIARSQKVEFLERLNIL